jgi:uncharacterized protein YecT (DUF1311 family)
VHVQSRNRAIPENARGALQSWLADCFRLETAIWDGMLNDNYQAFGAELPARQAARRDMQRAWIAARDSTCTFYDV